MTINGIIGKKIGMTRLFGEDGNVTPVTVLNVGPCTVTQVKTQIKDGYETVQLGFGVTKRLNKPMRGHLKTLDAQFQYLREVPVEGLGDVQVGQQIDASIFEPGDRVDVIGTSKGRGFTGVVKRYGFAGGPKTHGQSDRHRAPGSIGAGTSPGRVFKGRKMPGRMGNHRVTALNLEVAKVDLERNLLMIEGGIPGASRGLIMVRKSVKGSRRT
jgi:large subunit ribosomal protein L3